MEFNFEGKWVTSRIWIQGDSLFPRSELFPIFLPSTQKNQRKPETTKNIGFSIIVWRNQSGNAINFNPSLFQVLESTNG